MQIDGIKEFFPKFSSLADAVSGRKNFAASVLPAQKDTFDDTFDASALSHAGARLRFNRSEDITRLRGANASDPITGLMEKHLLKVEKILEKMHGLAAAAANKKLSELERMNMQIEMEDLRLELSGSSSSMNTDLARQAGYDGPGVGGTAGSDASSAGNDTRSVLQRARGRISKGEAWDVKEGSRQLARVKEVRYKDEVIAPNAEGMIALDLPEDAEWSVALSETAEPEIEYYAMNRNETSYAAAKTVRQKLETSGTMILMDSKSAERGVERLEAEVEKFKAIKEEFMAFKADPQRNRAMTKTEADTLTVTYASMQRELLSKKEKASEEAPGDETKLFLTEIGIMKTDESGANPELVYAANPKGQMFAKLGRFFESMAGNLSGKFVDEEVQFTGVDYVNLTGGDGYNLFRKSRAEG